MQTPLKSSFRTFTSTEDISSTSGNIVNVREKSDSNEDSTSDYTLKSSWKVKTFVIDTNVLLHDPDSLEAFKENRIVLGMPVIEELDSFKNRPGELGNNARTIIRKLDSLREKGSFAEGVKMPNGGVLKIVTEETLPSTLTTSSSFGNLHSPSSPLAASSTTSPIPLNDKILRLAYKLYSNGERVTLVTKNISTRLKADALGMQVEDYETGKVNIASLFVGYREISLDAMSLQNLNELLPRPESTKKVEKDIPKNISDSDSEKEDDESDSDSNHTNNSPQIQPENVNNQPGNENKQLTQYDELAIKRILLSANFNQEELLANEFLVASTKNNSNLRDLVIGRWKRMRPEPLQDEEKQPSPVTRLCHVSPRAFRAWNVEARSKQQAMALEVLQDPSVKLVTLIGQAGTGKTLLALASALEQVFRCNVYEHILVTRPIMPMGKDIGFLPGGKDDKLLPWMQPIFDNLDYLCPKKSANVNKYSILDTLHDSMPSKKGRKKRANSVGPVTKLVTVNQHTSKQNKVHYDAVIENTTLDVAMKKIHMEALAYIRGRSIMNSFVIVDECQNLTPHEIKTVLSRCGEGTKMVLTGDPYQIDNPYLDANSNGLSYCVEKLKTTWIHAHVTLETSERSDLAAIAAKLL